MDRAMSGLKFTLPVLERHSPWSNCCARPEERRAQTKERPETKSFQNHMKLSANNMGQQINHSESFIFSTTDFFFLF